MFLQKNVIFADKAHLFRKGNAEERPYGMAYAGQKRGVDAILVSFAWQSPNKLTSSSSVTTRHSPNKFGFCARLTKRSQRKPPLRKNQAECPKIYAPTSVVPVGSCCFPVVLEGEGSNDGKMKHPEKQNVHPCGCTLFQRHALKHQTD